MRLIFGIIFVAFILFLRQGIYGWFRFLLTGRKVD